MNVKEIFLEAERLVAERFSRDINSVRFDAANMLREGTNHKVVEKEEEKARRIVIQNYQTCLKISLVVELFVRSNYSLSDKQIADLIRPACEQNPSIPHLERSSVGRYLVHKGIVELYGAEIYRTILEKRKENLQAAKSTGGKAFAANNTAVKDEFGKFVGSIKK